MSTPLTAQPTIYMTGTCIRDIAVSFVGQLAGSELLTGTPGLAISVGGPVLSAPGLNAAVLKIETPDTPHYAKVAQAVTFRATASGTAAATYTATVTVSTVGGQSLQEFVTIVVSTS